MADWTATKNDYISERNQNEKLKAKVESQNEELKKLQEQIGQARTQVEGLLLQRGKKQEVLDNLEYVKQVQVTTGQNKLEELNRQLERALAEQKALQHEQNVVQVPEVAELVIKSKQSEVDNGKLKVEFELKENSSQIEVQEQLLANKKSVQLKGYAILDSTLYYFDKVIELWKQVQERESIELNGHVLTIIYK
ncbi:unnamed protein product (macronuclear) [Paramecium tetraurelia]|uniref:Uncharacterized protein n=1 Tax=Paramecium tetraurelia TaxID=5888 RepID=A0C3X1_PARTE|nr:uncharacterized protein GSPATT00034967001 [Paramecium tetraurelia]CAK65488.1 unnamed protein product [Paramecium tetraurelia]|eukprot:XP_001432885.1 hypothetical protein (macronuclear) [Paramecium tetraurelia strain d4-2]